MPPPTPTLTPMLRPTLSTTVILHLAMYAVALSPQSPTNACTHTHTQSLVTSPHSPVPTITWCIYIYIKYEVKISNNSNIDMGNFIELNNCVLLYDSNHFWAFLFNGIFTYEYSSHSTCCICHHHYPRAKDHQPVWQRGCAWWHNNLCDRYMWQVI